MIKKYISPIDNCEFNYQIVNGNLSYKIEGTDWQDFILEDKRAYTDEEYAEFLSRTGTYNMPSSFNIVSVFINQLLLAMC